MKFVDALSRRLPTVMMRDVKESLAEFWYAIGGVVKLSNMQGATCSRLDADEEVIIGKARELGEGTASISVKYIIFII